MASIQQAPDSIIKKFTEFGFKVRVILAAQSSTLSETMDQQGVPALSENFWR